jgi:hypothetical protein
MDPIPAMVQSGEDLAEDYVNLMNNSRREYIEPIKALFAATDTEALRTYASHVMESDCTKVYPIAAGIFQVYGHCYGLYRHHRIRCIQYCEHSVSVLLLVCDYASVRFTF